MANVSMAESAPVFRSQETEKTPHPAATTTTTSILDPIPSPEWAASLDSAVRTLNSPELVAFLNSSSYRVGTQLYAEHDVEAKAQQAKFMSEMTAANVCLMLTGVLSGLVLLGSTIEGQWGVWSKGVVMAVGILTLAFGALAAMWTYQARESDRLRRWFAARSGAEMARLSVFRQLSEAAMKAGPPAAGKCLGVVRRYLLEDQRAWLTQRTREHRRSLEWTTRWGGLATALAFVGGSGAVIASFQQNQAWIAIAGVLAAALSAYALNREGLRRDRINADRYDKARAALDELAARADMVADEIEAGRPDALTAFTMAITEQLESEHKQWLDGAAQVQALLAKFDEQLRKSEPPEAQTPKRDLSQEQ